MIDVILKFIAKMLDKADNRRGCGIAQSTDRITVNVVRNIYQTIQIFLIGQSNG